MSSGLKDIQEEKLTPINRADEDVTQLGQKIDKKLWIVRRQSPVRPTALFQPWVYLRHHRFQRHRWQTEHNQRRFFAVTDLCPSIQPLSVGAPFATFLLVAYCNQEVLGLGSECYGDGEK